MAGPEGEIARYLEVHAAGATFAIPGGDSVKVTSARFDHVLVKPEGEGYTAVTQVDAEAIYGAGVPVSYIGLERIPFVRVDGQWSPKGALLPGLQDVGATLLAHRQALLHHDLAALRALLAQGYQGDRAALKGSLTDEGEAIEIRRWTIRVERGSASVSEEVAPSRTFRARGQLRLELVREAGGFKILSGL